MEREERLRNPVLNAVIGFCICISGLSCSNDVPLPELLNDNRVEVVISVQAEGFQTRASNPEESLLSDINLIVFDEDGHVEECLWEKWSEIEEQGGLGVSLVKGRTYTFCACANFGMPVSFGNIEEIEDFTYHLSYPDGYREGIPMSAIIKDVLIEDNIILNMRLERMMAKISLRLDRSRLSEGVDLRVLSAKIGNCPRHSKVFSKNSLSSGDESFNLGFMRNEYECHVLNISDQDGISESLTLYMLENMQGKFSDNAIEDCEKVFSGDDPRKDICSYVELELSYLSDEMYSLGKGLIYRFYLGENASNLDVERNCHYHITVCPEDDGLSDGGWRVDKTNIFPVGETYIKGYPSSYIRGDIGDRIHIWCDVFPPNAHFDVGEEFMKEDKMRGIYDYEIDDDGFGATLTLTGSGTGLIYMEAGMPVYDAALFVIEVNLP